MNRSEKRLVVVNQHPRGTWHELRCPWLSGSKVGWSPVNYVVVFADKVPRGKPHAKCCVGV